MRLTLRTLLAWLDDMLPAEEVRRIGQQVDDSPFAREIVERIQRVTRQRRLTVPSSAGPDATDPNLVAEYLDDALTSEQVVEFEKKCLTSDVHLAEVASVHQILSLLGNKARVPDDAKLRMYHVLRGPESARQRPPEYESTADAAPQRVAAALPEWKRASPPPRRPADLWRPLLVLAGLLLALGWSTWDNLKPRSRRTEDVALAPPRNTPVLVAAADPDARPAAPAETQDRTTDVAEVDTDKRDGPPAGAADVEEKPAEAPSAQPARVAAANLVSLFETDGVVLAREPEAEKWIVASPRETIDPGTLVVNLKPYHSVLALGPLRVRLMPSTIIRLGKPAAGGGIALELIDGRALVVSSQPGGSLQITRGKASLMLSPPVDVPIGVQAGQEWTPGMSAAEPPVLSVYVPESTAKVAIGDEVIDVAGPGHLVVNSSGKAGTPTVRDRMPAWMDDDEVSAVDAELGKQFGRFFAVEKPPLAALVEASTSDQSELQRLAYDGLALTSRFSTILEALNAENQPERRRVAIDTLRSALARGEPFLAQLRSELTVFGEGEAWAKQLEALLVGAPPEVPLDGPTRVLLLDSLSHRDVAIRELALDALMRATKRDAMGYDPDAPTPESIKGWADQLSQSDASD